jgi:hypothetical protein
MGLPAWRTCESFLWRERDERYSFRVADKRGSSGGLTDGACGDDEAKDPDGTL